VLGDGSPGRRRTRAGGWHRARRALITAACLTALVALPLSSVEAVTISGLSSVRPEALAPGGVPAGARAIGQVSDAQKLEISVALPPSDPRGLAALLAALNDPASPRYHHWLHRGQFRAQFGPDPSTADAVISWLDDHGLHATLSGYLVKVSAPEDRVATALGVSFERYALPHGGRGYLATSTPLVPRALARGQIDGILGLSTVARFQSDDRPVAAKGGGTTGPADQAHADGLTPCLGAQTAAEPGYLTLDAMGSDYGVGSLLDDGLDGSGQTIGLYELGAMESTDIAAYQACFGLDNTVQTVNVDGGGAGAGRIKATRTPTRERPTSGTPS